MVSVRISFPILGTVTSANSHVHQAGSLMQGEIRLEYARIRVGPPEPIPLTSTTAHVKQRLTRKSRRRLLLSVDGTVLPALSIVAGAAMIADSPRPTPPPTSDTKWRLSWCCLCVGGLHYQHLLKDL